MTSDNWSSAGREDSKPTDESTHAPTNRRTFLCAAGAGAVGTTLLAGCTTGQNRSYEATEVGLDAEAEELGYTLESEEDVERNYDDSGEDDETGEVTVTSHLRTYRREGESFADDVLVGLLSTPRDTGEVDNPLADSSGRDFLDGDVDSVFVEALGLNGSWERGPDAVGENEGTLLDQDVGIETYAGVDGDKFVLANTASVEADDDVVHVIDVRVTSADGDRSSLVGDDGYVTDAEVVDLSDVFADLLAHVTLDVGGDPEGVRFDVTDSSEASVERQHTEEVPTAPEDPGELPSPDEGYPIPEDEWEEMKEKAADGELAQPPASEVQRAGEAGSASSFYAGSAGERSSSISVGSSIDAWDDSDMATPSDANISVGEDKAVLAVNLRWGIFDKATGNREFQVNLSDWFDPVIDDDTFVFDPVAVYDHDEDRHVLMAVAKNSDENDSSWVVAVSDDANPHGTWWLVRIPAGGDTHWVDYPSLGVDEDGIYLSGNIFQWGGGYDYTRLTILDKEPFYQGNGFTYWWFNGLEDHDGSNSHTLRPTDAMSGSEHYYLVNSKIKGGDFLSLWELRDATSNPVLWRYTVDVSQHSPPPNAEQPDTSDTLDSLDARLMNAVFVDGSVWTAHSISYDWNDNGNGDAILKWYEIDVGSRSVSQSRGYGYPGQDFYFPTIHSDGSSAMIVYNRSGPSLAPRIEVAGRTSSHTSDSLEDGALVKGGDSNFGDGGGDHRWGDYNGIEANPASSGYWVFSQYALDEDTDWDFATWAADVSF